MTQQPSPAKHARALAHVARGFRLAYVVGLVGFMGLTQGATAHAQDAHLGAQASECQAAMRVLLTRAPLSDSEQTRLQTARQIFGELVQKHPSRPPLPSADEAVAQLLALKQTSSANFTQTLVLCGAWAEGFLAQGSTYSYVPVYPKIVPMGVRANYEKLATQVQ